MVVEEKATTIEAMVRVAKDEATRAITRYKTSMEFEEEVNEVVYDAFYKGFDEC